MTADTHTALAQRWAELFNDDVEAMISELYSPTCHFSGMTMSHEKLAKFEKRVLAAAPRRNIRVDNVHGTGDVTVVEGTLLDPDKGDDWELGFCAVLTVEDGTIVSDNTYTDFSRWPGVN